MIRALMAAIGLLVVTYAVLFCIVILLPLTWLPVPRLHDTASRLAAILKATLGDTAGVTLYTLPSSHATDAGNHW